MKKDIDWHKSRLERITRSAIKTQNLANVYGEAVKRDRRTIAMYKAQIELAEKEGKAEFDSARYAVKRLKPIYELQETV